MKDNRCAFVERGLRLNFLKKRGVNTVRVTPCCHLVKDYLDDSQKKYIPIVDTSSITKHPTLKYYKRYFRQNEKLHPSCISCIREEESGIKSVRQKFNSFADGNLDYDFIRLDVVISNKCNLACPFCSQGSSSLIENLANKYSREDLPEHWKATTVEQADSEIVGQVCADLLKKYKIHSFKIIGGEPFLKENWEPIGKVLDEDYCKDLQLEVTTNGTVMNRKIIDRISKTKNTKLRISVDSIGKNYDFIRWPHRWNKMKNNLLFLRDNKPDNCEFTISILANIFNFEFLPDIEEFFRSENIKCNIDFTLKPLNSPLQWNNLPSNIIDYVYNNITDEESKLHISHGRKLINTSDLNMILKDTQFYLSQRQMDARDVLGPMTKEFLCL